MWNIPTESADETTSALTTTETIVWLTLSEEIPHEIRNLYHWAYAVYDFLMRTAGERIDLRELDRICLFRHTLIVHSEAMPFRKAGKVARGGLLWSAGWADPRIVSHPMWQGYDPLRGKRRRLRALYPYVQGLQAERNTWEKINIMYEDFNAISDSQLRSWVRKEVFGSSGLRSDSLGVIALALLDVFRQYARARRL